MAEDVREPCCPKCGGTDGWHAKGLDIVRLLGRWDGKIDVTDLEVYRRSKNVVCLECGKRTPQPSPSRREE